MVGPPVLYCYDNSFEGMLCAVAAAIKQQNRVSGIQARAQASRPLFERQVDVLTDQHQARRLWAYLEKLGPPAPRYAINGYLSEDRWAAVHLYHLVHRTLTDRADILHCRTHGATRYLEDLSRKVDREAHRLFGLLRFSVLENGLQYGPCEPACNIIGYLAQHFAGRLAGVCWVIHDTRRDIALYWDTAEVRPVLVDEQFTARVKRSGSAPEAALGRKELHFRQLWQSFHTAIANTARTNRHLQQGHMPKRYWNYLVEMQKR